MVIPPNFTRFVPFSVQGIVQSAQVMNGLLIEDWHVALLMLLVASVATGDGLWVTMA